MTIEVPGQKVLWFLTNTANNAERHVYFYVQSVPCTETQHPSSFLDTRLLPAYAAALSCVVLLLHYRKNPKLSSLHANVVKIIGSAHETSKSRWQSYAAQAGGLSIVVHKFLRMDSMFALLGLLTYSAIRDGMTLLRVIYILIAVRLLPQLCRCSLNTHLRSTAVYFLAGIYWHQLQRHE